MDISFTNNYDNLLAYIYIISQICSNVNAKYVKYNQTFDEYIEKTTSFERYLKQRMAYFYPTKNV